MSEITKLDHCFTIPWPTGGEDTKFYNGEEKPFRLYGMPRGLKSRIEENLDVPDNVVMLGRCTAGARIRFKTDSDYLVVRLTLPLVHQLAHMPLSSVVGCDAYIREKGEYTYAGTFIPPRYTGEIATRGGYESLIRLGERKMRDITINLPLFNPVSGISIGVNQDAVVEEGDNYSCEKPIVFYGSSVTQGCSASRPGNSYEAILSRRFDVDFINLGFAGNARAEKDMAEYVASLDMSMFVYDYDYNAPNVEHLEKTHKRMFDIIRNKHPYIPIIVASMPKVGLTQTGMQRREIIRETCLEAKKNGDQNVYFVDGTEFFKDFGGDATCTVDGIHPNDLGFWGMATKFAEVMEKISF